MRCEKYICGCHLFNNLNKQNTSNRKSVLLSNTAFSASLYFVFGAVLLVFGLLLFKKARPNAKVIIACNLKEATSLLIFNPISLLFLFFLSLSYFFSFLKKRIKQETPRKKMKVIGSITKKLLVGLLALATVISILQEVSPDGITTPVALATQAPSVSTNFEPNQDNQIFSSVTIAYTQPVQGAKVVISSGYQRGYDILKLKYTGGASLTTSFDSSTGTLSITGTSSGTEFQRILSSVYFYTTSRQNIRRTVYWNLGANVNYYSGTGNYYEWVSTSGRPSLAWTTARSDCSGRNHLGLTGYLATITSSSEFSFILQNSKYNSRT